MVDPYLTLTFIFQCRFDEGIKTDGEGLFSVTPEALARHQASRCNKPKSMVVDAFTGIGGNAIAFARAGHHVVAIDINPEKIEYARHNARVYGVEEKITFLVGDFFKLAPTLQADVVFLSPPWGGPHYSELPAYSLDMLEPADGVTLFRAASQVADNIMLFVPRHTVIDQLRTLPCRAAAAHARAGVNDIRCEVEHSYLDGRSKGITAYYGAQFARDGESRAAASTNSWRVPRNHCRDSFSSLLKKSSRKPLHSVRAW